MGAPGILAIIRNHGKLAVPAPLPGASFAGIYDSEILDPDILEADRCVRLEFPGKAPALFMPAARWSLTLLIRSCQFFAYRDIEPESIQQAFAEKCPHSVPNDLVADAYSVDLAMQHLPDLFRLARGLSPDDPLVAAMRNMAKQWPLSSVGISEIDELADLELDPILGDRSLAIFYVDRVIARNAAARLAHPRVRQHAKTAIGGHAKLAPGVAELLMEKA